MTSVPGLVLSIILVVGFTFSFSLLSKFVPETVQHPAFFRMLIWTPMMFVIHVLQSWFIGGKSGLSVYNLTLHSRKSLVPIIVVVGLAVLAFIFPSPKHDQMDMLSIIGVGVVGEEVLFRGIVWDLIKRWSDKTCFLRLSGTVWFAALAFGVTHLQYHHFQLQVAAVIQMSYSFFVGLGLGWVRHRTKSILWPMVAHSGFNSLFNLVLIAIR